MVVLVVCLAVDWYRLLVVGTWFLGGVPLVLVVESCPWWVHGCLSSLLAVGCLWMVGLWVVWGG